MPMKLSSSTFVAVILFIVISDYCLQATPNDQGKKRRGDESGPSKVSPTTTNTGTTNGDEWNLDSIIQFEINGQPTCIATLTDQRGCSDFLTIITVDGRVHHGRIVSPNACWGKLKKNAGRVQAKTADGDLVPFARNNKGDLILPEPVKLTLIPVARKKLSKGTKGMTTVWKEGTLTLKEFVVTDDQDCDIKTTRDVDYCAKNIGSETIDAGEGAPFFIKLDGTQVVIGLQMTYYSRTGGNTFTIPQVATLVMVPESELASTSSGEFDVDSIINIERNGRHLCLASTYEHSDHKLSLQTPPECIDKIKENTEGVKYKLINGEEVAVQLSVVGGKLIEDVQPDFTKLHFHLKVNAPLPIGTKGMAAVWDKGNVVWKEFIVTDIADCGLDAMSIALRYTAGSLNKLLCIKQVGGEKLNAGLGSPFYIKVRASQHLVGIQLDYVDSTGGNFYVT